MSIKRLLLYSSVNLQTSSYRRPRFLSHYLTLSPQPLYWFWSCSTGNFSTNSRSTPSSSMFSQRLNPLTGASEWVVVSAEDETLDGVAYGNAGKEGEAGDDSIVMSSYLDMLKDQERNEVYDKAISKIVQAGDHILDIGSGTGLLAMMAARSLRRKEKILKKETTAGHDAPCDAPQISACCQKRDHGGAPPGNTAGLAATAGPAEEEGSGDAPRGSVTTCEAFLPMAKLAMRVLRANGMAPHVRLVNKRSDEMEVGFGKDMAVKVNVLVSEILDSELLGEGLLPALAHAHAHLLTPGARVVPRRATIYAQVVESDFLQSCAEVQLSQAPDVPGGIRLQSPGRSSWGCHVSSRQWPVHLDALRGKLRPLTAPFQVFTFDFARCPSMSGSLTRQVAVLARGTPHAVVSWWTVDLDDDGTIQYSTAPAPFPCGGTSAPLAAAPESAGAASGDRPGSAHGADPPHRMERGAAGTESTCGTESTRGTKSGACGTESACSTDSVEHGNCRAESIRSTESAHSTCGAERKHRMEKTGSASCEGPRRWRDDETNAAVAASAAATAAAAAAGAAGAAGAAEAVSGGGRGAWCDHWKQCVFFLPPSSGGRPPVDTWQALSVTAVHDAISVSYDVSVESVGACRRQRDEEQEEEQHLNGCGLPGVAGGEAAAELESLGADVEARCDTSGKTIGPIASPERIWELNEPRRIEILTQAVQRAVGRKFSPHCLVADDSLLLSLLASKANSTARVTVMLPGGVPPGALTLARPAEGPGGSAALSGSEHGELALASLAASEDAPPGGHERLVLLGKRAEDLTSSDLLNRKLDAVLAEPYYVGCESRLPWHTLRFWHAQATLGRHLAGDESAVVPDRAFLRAVAVSVPDLWASRRSLADVAGFDHHLANPVIGACGAPVGTTEGTEPLSNRHVPILPCSTWQCGQYEELTERGTLMTFDLRQPMASKDGRLELKFSRAATCHAVVLWLDWQLGHESLMVGPSPYGGKQ
eukprot:jgi/Mesen1/3786/ME000206S02968